MIDATRLKPHGAAASRLKRGCSPRIGRMKGGLNSKLNAVCDGAAKPIILLLPEGQLSDHEDVRLILEALLSGSARIANRGNDSNWFLVALGDHDITSYVPPMKSRKVPIACDKTLDW